MRKTLFWVLLLTVSMTACKGGKTSETAATEEKEPTVGLAIDEASFPDPELRKAVLSTDAGEDGILTDAEIEDFDLLDVNLKPVKDFTGIELLKNLRWLHANNVVINSIDLSKNTKLKEVFLVGIYGLTSVTLGNQPDLELLNISGTSVGNIDLTQCPKLEKLYIEQTPIGALDLSGNPELKEISCDEVLMPGLDLSACPKAGFVD
ncbi:MAG: hypothetical protein K5896_01715 [Prevotella sp.]|nr:hypothetical protein [Prevotella sp.]